MLYVYIIINDYLKQMHAPTPYWNSITLLDEDILTIYDMITGKWAFTPNLIS